MYYYTSTYEDTAELDAILRQLEDMYAWLFLLAIVSCFIWGIVCLCIARSRGSRSVGWFFLGFGIGVAGMIIVLCVVKKKPVDYDNNNPYNNPYGNDNDYNDPYHNNNG